MAIIQGVNIQKDNGVQVTHTMGHPDTGTPIDVPRGTSEISMQVVGTFASGDVALQGSNDGTNWVDLDDLSGTVIAISAAGFQGTRDRPMQIRPEISGGGGTTALTVTIFMSTRAANG